MRSRVRYFFMSASLKRIFRLVLMKGTSPLATILRTVGMLKLRTLATSSIPKISCLSARHSVVIVSGCRGASIGKLGKVIVFEGIECVKMISSAKPGDVSWANWMGQTQYLAPPRGRF